MKIQSATVIPHPLPNAQHVSGGIFSEINDRRESFDKLTILWEDPKYLRLLEHDFGNHNPVRIAGMPPREITAVGRPP